MTEQVKKNSHLGWWIFAVAFALFVGTLVVGSMRVVQAECELCVEYRGARECRSGSGATEAEAQSAAQRAACAVMASGMNESIACSNAPATNVQCRS